MDKKTLLVSRDCHQKIKLIASLEGQTMQEWVEWAINKAYESAMHNRGRKGLSVIKK